MGTFLVTDTPQAVEPHHRVVVWLGQNHGPLPGKVAVHAPSPNDFLRAAIEHVQPALAENFECALTGEKEKLNGTVQFLLEQYHHASRQAHFDLNTLSWTYKLCALQSLQKTATLPDQIHTIDQLEDRHRDEACVIIGAGPSLDIAGVDPRKILTIATTRTAIMCLKAGWCPDYIIHIDPDPFERVRSELLSHPLIGHAKWFIPFQVHQNFVNLPGQVFWFGSRLNPASNWIAKQLHPHLRIPLIVSGGSVSCCAFTIAEFMGCSPICLIGQDLSYLGGGKYFGERHLDRYTSVVMDEPDRIFLPAIGGGKVETTIDYSSYAEWFLTQAMNTRRKAVNCTPRGVYLPGFEHIPIQKVYYRYCRSPKPPKPGLAPRPFPRPDVRAALQRCRIASRQVSESLAAGNAAKTYDLLLRMNHIDADGFILTACTQYEQKILSYFSHLPPAHPQMKRSIELLADATARANDLIAAALDGNPQVPDLTEESIARRMKELNEINALA